MSPRTRLLLFLAASPALALLLGWGFRGLSPFGRYPGPYGDVLNRVAIPERHVTNVVTAVNFDYRAMDTLGEEYILFAAITGLDLLLRRMRGEQARQQHQIDSGDAVRWLGLTLTGVTVVFGLYIVLHGPLTPGGGFQGGVILGTAALLVYLVNDFKAFAGVSPRLMLNLADSGGAGAYASLGLITLIASGAFLRNTLPLGQVGDLLSGGMILVINLAVGLEVSAGFVLLFRGFVEQTANQQEDRP